MNKSEAEKTVDEIMEEVEFYADRLECNLYCLMNDDEDDVSYFQADQKVYDEIDNGGLLMMARAKADVDFVIYQCKHDMGKVVGTLHEISKSRDDEYMSTCRLMMSIYHSRYLKRFDKYAMLL